jgi:hypothetical protein
MVQKALLTGSVQKPNIYLKYQQHPAPTLRVEKTGVVKFTKVSSYKVVQI